MNKIPPELDGCQMLRGVTSQPNDHVVNVYPDEIIYCCLSGGGEFIDSGGRVEGYPENARWYRKIPQVVEVPVTHEPFPSHPDTENGPDAVGLPDSGARTEYVTGAVRDASAGKGHFHSIPPIALRKLAQRFEAGAKKYSKNNWMKGIALSHYSDSLTRHKLALEEGDTVEDHAGALIWNSVAMVWTMEEIAAGRLPAELNDLPFHPNGKRF
jgi:hypothetical protein